MQIEILIPSYNNAVYLKQCLDSIFSQTHKDLFVTFLDDCSTDGTEQIIKGYSDSKIQYFKNDINIGEGLSRNKLIQLASSKICCWMDSDDYILPSKIEKQLEFLTNNEECCFVSTEMIDLFKNGKTGESCNKAKMINELTLEKLRVSNCLNHATMMFKLEEARKIGYGINRRNEDWNFGIRLYEKGYKVSAIPYPLYVYRLRV